MQIKGGKLQFIDRNKQVVCKIEDFLFGLKDKVPYKSDVPYGSFILMKDSFLEAVLSKQGLRLAYICKINYSTKKYSYSDEATDATFYELINFSPILT